MGKECKTIKEFVEAVKNKESVIIIEGEFKNHVFRIMIVGPVAWGVCGVALAAAIALYIATPVASVTATPAGGAAFAVSGTVAATVAAAGLGTAATTAIVIGVVGGGIGILNTIRSKYKIAENTDKRLVLKRK